MRGVLVDIRGQASREIIQYREALGRNQQGAGLSMFCVLAEMVGSVGPLRPAPTPAAIDSARRGAADCIRLAAYLLAENQNIIKINATLRKSLQQAERVARDAVHEARMIRSAFKARRRPPMQPRRSAS